jgi:hypothetical protein
MTRRIMCDQTGEEFPSQSAAVKWLGVSHGLFSSHMRCRNPSNIKGYTFKRLDGERYVWSETQRNWRLEEQ